LRRYWPWVRWRALVLVVVYGVGLSAFSAGVATGERPELASEGFLAHVYYTLGLFVLGGLDLGLPRGGPALARVALWFAYFAAPAITASALVESVLRVLNPERWRMRRLKDHIVIAGGGHLALLYLSRLRESGVVRPVIVVDNRSDYPVREIAREGNLVTVSGDINTGALLRTLRLEHAARVLLLTGDDFVNLNAAARILQLAPELENRTIVHVSDLRFLRAVGNTRVGRACEIFNSHQIAAVHVVETEMLRHFESTEAPDSVVLGGFGRFGQTVLDELQRRARGQFNRVVIIDTEVERRARVFEEDVGFREDYQRLLIPGDLRDPDVWRKADAFLGDAPVYVVGSGDDGTNVRTALWLSVRYPKARVIARSFESSLFASDVAKERGFYSFSVADLVIRSIPERWLTLDE
jgi:voltage-gated potassium channel Kch